MLINQNGRTNVRDVRIKQYSHDADTITVVVDRNRAGHDLSVLPLQLLIGAQDIMNVVAEGVDDVLTKVVNEDSIEVTWRPQGRHTAGSDRIMCQIVFADYGNVVAYTDTFAVVVEKSLKQIKDCVYADGYTMLDQYLRRLESIRDETQGIRDSIGDTAAGAGAAAKQAQEAAADAERSARVASESAEDAAASAVQASESAKAVAADRQEAERLLSETQTAAGAAESAQRGAELAASAASSAAGQAQESARGAAGSASAAAGSAQEAQTNAQEAAESAADAATAKQDAVKAGKDAVEGIQFAKDKAIKDVQDAAVEITADREQIARNKADIAALAESLEVVQNRKAGAIVDKASGTSILLQGSDEAWGDGLIIYGGSTQGSTTGAQLFDAKTEIDGFINGVGVLNGASPINKEKTSDYIQIPKESKPTHITATASGNPKKGNHHWIGLSYYDVGKAFIKRPSNSSSPDEKKFTLINDIPPEAEYFRLSYRKYEDVVVMLSFGASEKPYEPYTGGKPSPSPEYPQEIESVGVGEIGVSVGGGNLIDKSQIVIGYGYGVNGVFGVAPNRAGIEKIPAKKGTYTVSNTSGFAVIVCSFDSNGNMLKRQASINSTFETPADTDYIGLTFYEGVTSESELEKVMLNIGSTALPYEPYKPLQTAIIPTPDGLPGIPVTSGGNYTDADGQQWVCDTIEYRRGKAVRVCMVGKNVVDGEKLKFTESYDKHFWNLPVFTAPDVDDTMLTISNYFPISVFRANSTNDFIWSSPSKMNSYFETPDELNQFCIEKNSEGKPLTIYYCRETPIETPLSPEATAQLAALRTYSPTTTVVNDEGAGMSVSYVTDTKTYIDKKFDEMMKALANTQAHLL